MSSDRSDCCASYQVVTGSASRNWSPVIVSPTVGSLDVEDVVELDSLVEDDMLVVDSDWLSSLLSGGFSSPGGAGGGAGGPPGGGTVPSGPGAGANPQQRPQDVPRSGELQKAGILHPELVSQRGPVHAQTSVGLPSSSLVWVDVYVTGVVVSDLVTSTLVIGTVVVDEPEATVVTSLLSGADVIEVGAGVDSATIVEVMGVPLEVVTTTEAALLEPERSDETEPGVEPDEVEPTRGPEEVELEEVEPGEVGSAEVEPTRGPEEVESVEVESGGEPEVESTRGPEDVDEVSVRDPEETAGDTALLPDGLGTGELASVDDPPDDSDTLGEVMKVDGVVPGVPEPGLPEVEAVEVDCDVSDALEPGLPGDESSPPGFRKIVWTS